MKNLFKASLLAVILLAGVSASAQVAPISYGIRGGINLSNLSGDISNTDAKVGFNVGVTADYALAEAIYLQSGLELTTKGAKMGSGDNSVTINSIYIQLPIHAAYKLEVMEGTKVVLFAGPYFAYGVGGKTTTKVLGVSSSEDTFGSDAFRRFDIGLGLGAGAEFGKIGVTLGYDFGLSNISREVGSKIRNRNAYLSLGYRF